jgi:hypothetical protein
LLAKSCVSRFWITKIPISVAARKRNACPRARSPVARKTNRRFKTKLTAIPSALEGYFAIQTRESGIWKTTVSVMKET